MILVRRYVWENVKNKEGQVALTVDKKIYGQLPIQWSSGATSREGQDGSAMANKMATDVMP